MFKKLLVISAICFAVSASSLAMSRDEGRRHDRDDHAKTHRATYRPHHDRDHDRDDRRGWEKGKKEGWRGAKVPPAEARRHHETHQQAAHHRRDLDRDRDQHRVAQKPVAMGARPVSQTDRNRTWANSGRQKPIQQQKAQ